MATKTTTKTIKKNGKTYVETRRGSSVSIKEVKPSSNSSSSKSSSSSSKASNASQYDKNINYNEAMTRLVANPNYDRNELDRLMSARDAKIKAEGIQNVQSTQSLYNTILPKPSKTLTAQDYVTQYTGQKQAKAITPFETLVPYQQFISKLDPQAENLVNPEAMRVSSDAVRDYDTQASRGGGYQFSGYNAGRGQLLGNLERDRQQQVSDVKQKFKGTLDNVWTNLSQKYYGDPNLDTQGTINSALNTAVPGVDPNNMIASHYAFKPKFTFY